MLHDASDVFVTTNNTVYATAFGLASVLVWTEGSSNVTSALFGDLSYSHRIFVISVGDVYADDTVSHSRVAKWKLNTNNSVTIMNISGACGGIFIDIYDSFYCSHTWYHEVLKKPVHDYTNSPVLVAGNCAAGSATNMLYNPYGIFVDIDLNLYVADFGNNRIQRFRSGQLNATTLVGDGAPGTISIYNPIVVILDGIGYLFIAEYGNHRIIGSGPNGFRCVVGCTGINGTAANQLTNPRGLSFDSYGNLYVADAGNSRIQKFMLAKNSCGKSSETELLLEVVSFTFEIRSEENWNVH